MSKSNCSDCNEGDQDNNSKNKGNISHHFKANNVEVKKVAEFDNIETIKRAVEVGFGLAIVPEPAVIEARNAGTVSVIELAEKYWIRSVGVIYRSDRALSLAAKKFVELLSQGNP